MGNSNLQRMLLQSSNNITYNHTWNDKHYLTVTGVWEATKSTIRNMGISGSSLQAESVGWWDVKNAVTRDATNGYSDWALLSGWSRSADGSFLPYVLKWQTSSVCNIVS